MFLPNYVKISVNFVLLITARPNRATAFRNRIWIIFGEQPFKILKAFLTFRRERSQIEAVVSVKLKY